MQGIQYDFVFSSGALSLLFSVFVGYILCRAIMHYQVSWKKKQRNYTPAGLTGFVRPSKGSPCRGNGAADGQAARSGARRGCAKKLFVGAQDQRTACDSMLVDMGSS